MATKLKINDLTEVKSLDSTAQAAITGGSARNSLFSHPIHGASSLRPQMLQLFIDRSQHITTVQQDNDVIYAAEGATVTNIGGNYSSASNSMTDISVSIHETITGAVTSRIQSALDNAL
ncbi:MAG: hypothetical protein ACR2P1_19395 [Pseudomonadales bacterium]